MAGIYVVLGASGHVGSVVASRLLDAGEQVRVVARNAARLAPLAARGAEPLPGPIEDEAFLRRAFAGARAAFVLLPPYFGSGIRAWQERAVGALGGALAALPLPRVVLLSAIGADASEGNGPAAGLHRLERRLGRIPGLSTLRLRPGYFFENLIGAIDGVREEGRLALAFRPDLRVPMIASRDIGEVAARHLRSLDWTGNAVQELQGERDLTLPEVAAALGRAIGRPELEYAQLPYADVERYLVAAGVTAEAAALYMEMTRGFNERLLRKKQGRNATTTTPTSIERWAAEIFAPVYAASGARRAAEERATHA